MAKTVTVNVGDYKFAYCVEDDGRTTMSDEDMQEMVRYFYKGVFAEVDKITSTLTWMPALKWDIYDDTQP